MLIFTDHFAGGGSGEYFLTDLVQCDGASRQLLGGVAMDTSLPCPEVLKPPANS